MNSAVPDQAFTEAAFLLVSEGLTRVTGQPKPRQPSLWEAWQR